MFSKKSVKALKNNGFKAVFVGFTSVALVISLSACSPFALMKSTFADDVFPSMPAPEVATYVLDLSGSTYPTAQLEALGSGISDFIAGQSLGNPFAVNPVAPRGLSIQFVTKNSAQAPRILLVSTSSSQRLFKFVKDKDLNIEGARQLWSGLIRARTEIWQNSVLEADSNECINRVVASLGRQQLLPDVLREPANIICQDAKQTALALNRLQSFVANPGIKMGSDVEGAIQASLKNLGAAQSEFPNAHLALVIASDLVDEEGLDLPHKLTGVNIKNACDIATKDAQAAPGNYSAVSVVFVGSRNSKINTNLLDRVHSYWTCYFNQLGITNIKEQSDLSGF